MTDPVHIHARRLIDYIDGDANGPGEQLLAHRPYLTALVADLRVALEDAPRHFPRGPVGCSVQVSSGGVAE